MSYDYLFFEVVSPTAGLGRDGLISGNINSSALVAAALVAKVVPIVEVRREDKAGNDYIPADVTAAATNAAAGDFTPFGTSVQMSVGDSFLFRVAPEKDCSKLHSMIAVPGIGNYTIGYNEYNPTTGEWQGFSNLVDGTTHFKAAAGVQSTAWTHVTKGTLKLHHRDLAAYVWHQAVVLTCPDTSSAIAWAASTAVAFGALRIAPAAAGSILAGDVIKSNSARTTRSTFDVTEAGNWAIELRAPVLSRLWAEDKNVVYTDMTAHINSGDWTGFPGEFLPTLDAYSLRVHPGPPAGEDVDIAVPASGTYTTTKEYLASGGVYKAITNLVDPSNDYTLTGTHRLKWTRPADWVSQSVTIDGNTVTGWVERRRITAIATPGPVALHQTRTRSRSLGAANCQGIPLAAGTYRYATFSGFNTATAETVVDLINGATGATTTVRIPAGVDESTGMPNGKLALSAPYANNDGEQLLVEVLSGGPVVAMHTRLHP